VNTSDAPAAVEVAALAVKVWSVFSFSMVVLITVTAMFIILSVLKLEGLVKPH
jgi:hypothetical protein